MPCNKLFLYNPPYHKHIEARMLMVRKTVKQFYIKKYSLFDVGIVIRVSPIFTLRRQGTIFGTTGLNFRVREMWSPKSPAFWRKDE